MITKNKILIIKLGHSETLAPEISKECSLGDVVRTTVILNYFRSGDNITWLCDEKATPLLEGNSRINRVLPWNMEVALQLQRERFDMIVNLEKHPGLCALSDSMNAWQKYGFRFNDWQGQAEAHLNTEKVLEICQNPLTKDKNKKYWQEHLAKVIGKHWSLKDTYIMKPREGKTREGIGLNWRVGSKWPNKQWRHWDELAKMVTTDGFSIHFQPDLALESYMDWISERSLLITCDSLGMHLAIAYGIPVVALFGPTSSSEVYFYGKGLSIQAEKGNMENITPLVVYEKAKELMNAHHVDRKKS